jgi:hypothetical protein
MTDPFVIGRFTWIDGRLQLHMVGTSIDGKPSVRNPMPNLRDAHRWASRQAARQFHRRHSKILELNVWRVIDLRRLSAAV